MNPNTNNETIAQFLNRNIAREAAARALRLRELNAPEVLITLAEAKAQNPLGSLGGVKKFGGKVFSSWEKAIGLRGKQYTRFHIPGEQDILCVFSNWGGRYLYQQKAKE